MKANIPQERRFWLWLPQAVLLLMCVLLLLAILRLNDGRFIYALDDPYIHLAFSEELARGHFGLNEGEYAAPSSSIVWPLLLTPFAAWPVHEYVPLVLNLLFAFALVCAVQRSLRECGMAEWPGGERLVAGLTLLLLFGFNIPGIAFMGMEHVLQILCAAAAAWGLLVFLRAQQAPWWWIVAVVLGPSVRYENALLTVAVCGVLFLKRRYLLAVVVAGVAALPLMGYSLWLLSLGLGPLPSSVLAKALVHGGEAPPGLVARLAQNLFFLGHPGARLPIAIALCAIVTLVRRPRGKDALLAGVIVLVVGGYFLGGRFGQRYEIFMCVFVSLLAVALYRERLQRTLPQLRRPLVAGVVIVAGAVLLGPHVERLISTPVAANNIYEQQYQMHRFVTEYHRGPVAVNDLGWVAYRNPHYVLDLWGLGSEAARIARMQGEREWLGEIVSARKVPLAMIYTAWFEDEIPASWEHVAALRLSRRAVSAARGAVDFYATSPDQAGPLREALEAFGATLPPRVGLEIIPQQAESR